MGFACSILNVLTVYVAGLPEVIHSVNSGLPSGEQWLRKDPLLEVKPENVHDVRSRKKMNFKETRKVAFDFLLFIGMAILHIAEAVIFTFVPRRYREKSIKGEIVLITGGAGGIGKLIAVKLARLGARVVLWDIDKPGLQKTVDEIRKTSENCWGYYCDISKKEEVYKTAKLVKIEVGNVNLLINNAGYVYGKTLIELPDSEIEKTFKVNILSHYWITKAFLKDMMKDNHGHIVTIASVAGLVGTYNCTDYSATKFAAVGYHESLFTELRAHGYDGIHLTLVCPYLINTGMFHGVKPRLLDMLEPEYVAEEVVSGILLNEVNVTLPRSVKFYLPFKYLFPAKLCWDLMYHIVQGPQCMMKLKDQGERYAFKENNNVYSTVASDLNSSHASCAIKN